MDNYLTEYICNKSFIKHIEFFFYNNHERLKCKIIINFIKIEKSKIQKVRLKKNPAE